LVRDTYDQSLAELPRLPDAGVRTLKVFSAYTDAIGLSIGQIHKVLRRAAESGVTVFVHAETDSLVREGIADAVERVGIGPRGHAASRTPLAENDAVRSLCDLARDTGATVYFVHISSAPSIDTLTDRRRQGDHILAETCPHYLFLDESVYAGTAGERWICSPPIRSAEHRAALWKGLLAGVIDTISSDHNCYDMAQKQVSADFRQVPNGLPGIEYRLPLLIDAAIRQELPWRRLAEVTAETPARILGLWPRKGSICIGGDADIVLVDPTAHTDLSAGHMATDYSPYAGTRAAGRVVKVYRRGLLVADETGVVAPRGSGEWLPLTVGPLMGERARLTGAPPN
jgi:dihydropyrimidinase